MMAPMQGISASMIACIGRYVEVPFGASCRGLLDSDAAMCMHTFQFQFQFQFQFHTPPKGCYRRSCTMANIRLQLAQPATLFVSGC